MATETLRRYRQFCMACRGVTLILLSTSILLTLLVLLTPTQDKHLSFFSLAPVNHGQGLIATQTNATFMMQVPANSTSATIGAQYNAVNSTREGVPSHDTGGRVFGDGERSESVVKRGAEVTTWSSQYEPSIWVGALQICSKRSDTAKVECTSTSNAANVSILLPANLALPLLILPKSPITPVLLLASGLSAWFATIIYLWHIFDCSAVAERLRTARRRHRGILRRHPHLRDHTRPSSSASVDSMTTLVNSSGQLVDPSIGRKKRKMRTHFAFLVFAVPAFCLSLTGTAIQLVQVSKAKGAWDEVEAHSFGMQLERGVLSYLMPVLPVAILLALCTAYIPALYSRLGKHLDVEAIAVVENPSLAMTSPERPVSENVKAAHVPDPLKMVSNDRPTKIPDARREFEKIEELSEEGGEDQDTRRNTFGTVGVAV